jgi:hypothetical protein
MRRYIFIGLATLLGVLLTIGLSQGSARPSFPSPAIATDPSRLIAMETVDDQVLTESKLDADPVLTAQTEAEPTQTDPGRAASLSAFRQAVEYANNAAVLAQSATTPQQWDRVAESWMGAIAQLFTIPPKSPQRVFAQRKIREYLQNLSIAQRYADRSSFPRVSPDFGSSSLNEQLALYQSYVATVGVPDVLMIGSSRSLQGVDPQVLQVALAEQGYANATVYNFGVYGATAQVVNFLVQQVLPPEHLPRLIVFPGGSRAFNSGRVDRTFASILGSEGYQELRKGYRLPRVMKFSTPESFSTAPEQSLNKANANGFILVSEQFNPREYYQQYPRVPGIYDGDYVNFNLNGVQSDSLRSLAQFATNRGIKLVYVNLPLTQDYLDATRSRYEGRYRQWMQQQSQTFGFTFVDLLESNLMQNQYFADPSHINRFGAAAIARRLANHAQMPWQVLLNTTSPSEVG